MQAPPPFCMHRLRLTQPREALSWTVAPIHRLGPLLASYASVSGLLTYLPLQTYSDTYIHKIFIFFTYENFISKFSYVKNIILYIYIVSGYGAGEGMLIVFVKTI